jgi:putative peptidoglycan lipid II flippase
MSNASCALSRGDVRGYQRGMVPGPPSTTAAQTPFYRVLLLVFGGSLVVQALAFIRQIVIAAAFGLDRAMDLYVMVFAVATITAFALSNIIENAAVPLLVRELDAGDRARFRTVATRVVLLGFGIGIISALVFGLAVPVFAHVVALGLTPDDRAAMADIAPWFIGWVLLAAPYYAIGSVLKAERRFRRFFVAEIIVTLVSMGILLVWRPHVGAIAVAYGLGYGVGLLAMLAGVPLALGGGAWRKGASLGIRRQLSRLFVANQAGSLTVLIDRFLQSFLPTGGVAAASYASLISMQASGLLTFRDAYMGPLSLSDGRTQKLERVMIGLAMLSIPSAVFISAHAEPIVSVLLERGRFDRAASTLAGAMLQVQAIAIVSATLLLPLFRLLQILDRMRFTAYVLLMGAVALLLFGSAFVIGLGLGPVGYALALVASSFVTLFYAIWLTARAGVTPNWPRVASYAVFAATVSVVAALVSRMVPEMSWRVLTLGLSALVFSAMVLLAYGAIHARLRRIVQDT